VRALPKRIWCNWNTKKGSKWGLVVGNLSRIDSNRKAAEYTMDGKPKDSMPTVNRKTEYGKAQVYKDIDQYDRTDIIKPYDSGIVFEEKGQKKHLAHTSKKGGNKGRNYGEKRKGSGTRLRL